MNKPEEAFVDLQQQFDCTSAKAAQLAGARVRDLEGEEDHSSDTAVLSFSYTSSWNTIHPFTDGKALLHSLRCGLARNLINGVNQQMPEFEQLKQKYQSVLETIQKQGGQLQNLNRDGDQLFVKATVPSEEAKNRVWDAIKAADPNYTDLKHEIEVSATASQTNQTTYTVQPGDNLSKISQHFYGDANKYNTIVKANNLANPIRSSRDKNSS
jgi:hypothetical protein